MQYPTRWIVPDPEDHMVLETRGLLRASSAVHACSYSSPECSSESKSEAAVRRRTERSEVRRPIEYYCTATYCQVDRITIHLYHRPINVWGLGHRVNITVAAVLKGIIG